VTSHETVPSNAGDTVDTQAAPWPIRAWLIAQALFYVLASILLLSQAFHLTAPVRPGDIGNQMLASPWGRLALLTIGLVIAGVGAVLTFHSLAYGRPWDLFAAPDHRRVMLQRLGRVGFVGRGLMFVVPGVIISANAWVYSPRQGGGVTDGVRTFLQRPYGSALLVALALALLAFAAYEIAAARYRRVPLQDTAHSSLLTRTRASMHAGRTSSHSSVDARPSFKKLTRIRAGKLVGAGVLLWAATAGVGFLLVHTLTPSVITRWDNSVSEWFFMRRTATLNQLTLLGTGLADTMTCITVTAMAVVVLGLWLGRWRESVVVVAAIEGELLIFLMVTATVGRLRPVVPHLDAAPPTSSFPSGHTGAAVALYGCIAVIVLRNIRRRWLALTLVALCLAVPVVVGLSRIYRGMHFPTDVLAGAIAGGVWLALVVTVLLAKLPTKQGGVSQVTDQQVAAPA
jgi:undecaprenyl-diphosphatase